MQPKSNRKNIWIVAGLVVACLCLFLLGLGLNWWFTRNQSPTGRPIVWFGAPTHHQVYSVGESVQVNAYVRSDQPVARLELWIDSRLVENILVEDGQSSELSDLRYTWQGAGAGAHALVARAITADGIAGQATVLVEMSGLAEQDYVYHVQEGDTLASISAEIGIPEQDLLGANGDIPIEGLAAGDELIIPDEAVTDDVPLPGSVAGGPSTPVDEAPPAVFPEPENPTGFARLFFFLQNLDVSSSAEPVPLRIELLDLATQGLYESLHCYIAATGSLPRWYPDTDNDQTTDESFALNAEGSWNISEYYAGNRAPVIMWPGNEDLSLDISCTGVVNGGAEAIQAGHLTLAIPVTQWDDQARWATSEVQEDGFLLKYKIGHTTPNGRGIPLVLDLSMTSPTDLILDNGVLRWSYIPDEEDDPIDGFLIYFNDNVVWTVPASERSYELSPEWLLPTCESNYSFSVGTVIGVYPVSRESPQSNTVTIEPQNETCSRRVRITFMTLETHDMPEEEPYEGRSGDIGPIYGQFTANTQRITFNTGISTAGGDVPPGWRSDTVYNLIEMAETDFWNFSDYPSLVVQLSERGNFFYTFGMSDDDPGPCEDPSDPGCNEQVCSGVSRNIHTITELTEPGSFIEETITSDNGRCSLSVRIEFTGDSTTDTSVSSLSLPYIAIDSLEMADSRGIAKVNFTNSGSAVWPDTDLEVELLTRTGELIETRVLENYDLGIRGHDSLIFVLPEGMHDYCVVFDPNNLVTEEGELNDMISEYRDRCLESPDLSVESARFNRLTSNLQVGIRNLSDEGFSNRTLQLMIAMSGQSEQFILEIPSFSMTGHSAATIQFPLTDSQRDQMTAVNSDDGIGYTINVNQNHYIYETDYENNSYQVAEARDFYVALYQCCSDAFVSGMVNEITMTLGGSIGYEHQFEWHSPELSLYKPVLDPIPDYECWDCSGYNLGEDDLFRLMGDEALYLWLENHVVAGAEDYSLGSWNTLIDPNNPQDYFDSIIRNSCSIPHYGQSNGEFYPHIDYPGEDDGRPDPGEWQSIINVCRLSEDD